MKKKTTINLSKRRKSVAKVSFKSLGRVGKCVLCGATLNENMNYKTKYCDECCIKRIHEKRSEYRKKHPHNDTNLLSTENKRIEERRKQLLEKRRKLRTEKLDPVVRTVEKGNGITVHVRGNCFGGGGGCQHIGSYMARWR